MFFLGFFVCARAERARVVVVGGGGNTTQQTRIIHDMKCALVVCVCVCVVCVCVATTTNANALVAYHFMNCLQGQVSGVV
jgi:hypothetical protein